MSAAKLQLVADRHFPWSGPRFPRSLDDAVFIPGVGHGYWAFADERGTVLMRGESRYLGTIEHDGDVIWSLRTERTYTERARYLITQACDDARCVIMRKGLGTIGVYYREGIACFGDDPSRVAATFDVGGERVDWRTAEGLTVVQSRRVLEAAILAGLCPECFGVACGHCNRGWVNAQRKIVRLAGAGLMVPHDWRLG